MESWVVSSSWLLQVSCYKWRCCECWRLVDIGSFFLGIAGSEGCCVFNFIRNCQTVFHSCTIFYSPAMNEDSTCSISWKSASWVLNLSHSGGCEEASCGTFTLNCSVMGTCSLVCWLFDMCLCEGSKSFADFFLLDRLFFPYYWVAELFVSGFHSVCWFMRLPLSQCHITVGLNVLCKHFGS